MRSGCRRLQVNESASPTDAGRTGAGWDSSPSGQIRRSAWELLRVVNGTPRSGRQGSACSTTGSTGDLAERAGSNGRQRGYSGWCCF
jgi:hypothetical protein